METQKKILVMSVMNRVGRKGHFFVFALVILSYFGCLCTGSETAYEDSTNHFKMLSTVEYSGKGQFRSQAEKLITVNKQHLADEKVRYSFTSDSLGLNSSFLNLHKSSSARESSVILDRKTNLDKKKVHLNRTHAKGKYFVVLHKEVSSQRTFMILHELRIA